MADSPTQIALTEIWQNAQSLIENSIGANTYETWFANISVESGEDGTLLIETPDEFYKDWIIDHYLSDIRKSVEACAQRPVPIEFRISQDTKKSAPTPAKTLTRTPQEKPVGQPYTSSRFTFENFVIGPSNRFACAASLAVAESPAKAYNPLFIYGQVGLGKTHLMQAIAHQARLNHPGMKCCYLSSEQFTNELIDSIRHRSTSQFRQKYRHIDVLLIDDIHFIAGKESTQEEFFHTFNALHDNRKQIIISSDRPPKEISNLEERLISRFTWGLITDIQPPDFETRVAILRKKLELENVSVPDDVIYFIADEIKTNIRELEGALIRVVAFALLEDKPVSLSTAKQTLKDMVKETSKIISVEMIQKHVADFFNLQISDLKARRRSKQIVLPRQISMYLCRKLTPHSLPEIGNAFGGKDHTTVLHSCKKIEQDINSNSELKRTIEQLTSRLNQ